MYRQICPDLFCTLVSDSDWTLDTRNTKLNLEYSKDGGTSWYRLEVTQKPNLYVEKGRVLLLRGISNKRLTHIDFVISDSWIFSGVTNFRFTGNIATLLDYKEVAANRQPDFGDFCCMNMFRCCRDLVQAPQLTLDNLTKNCYSYMFCGCEKLTMPPLFLTKSLEGHCCERMLRDCTNLINPLILPDVMVRDYCYTGLYEGCISLVGESIIPNGYNAVGCYDKMYDGCFGNPMSLF